jgi:hypothetical protein
MTHYVPSMSNYIPGSYVMTSIPKPNWPEIPPTCQVLIMKAVGFCTALTILNISEDGMYTNPHYSTPFIIKGVDNL